MMNHSVSFDLPDEDATMRVGAALASIEPLQGQILLHGRLGAGKTTLVRGFLKALGHAGPVKSPTYTLVEPYDPGGRPVFHLDIYRLSGAAELENLGIRDLLAEGNTLLVEWPERAQHLFTRPVLDILLTHEGDARNIRLSCSDQALLSLVRDACLQELGRGQAMIRPNAK